MQRHKTSNISFLSIGKRKLSLERNFGGLKAIHQPTQVEFGQRPVRVTLMGFQLGKTLYWHSASINRVYKFSLRNSLVKVKKSSQKILSVVCRPTIGRLLTVCRETVGQLLTNCHSTVGRLSAMCR